MEPEFGIGIGAEKGGGASTRPRPSLGIRLLEWSGLGLVSYGLGAYRFGWAALGGGMIIGSYAIYRWQHGPQTGTGGRLDGPDGGDGDGGGD